MFRSATALAATAASSAPRHQFMSTHMLHTTPPMHRGLFSRLRGPRLLSPAERLKRFGAYSLILPSESVLNGTTLEMSDRPLPSSIPRPPYDFSTGKPLVTLDATHINSAAEVAGMEAAGRLARSVLASAAASVVPGMTTLDIDRIVHDKVVEGGAYPSPLGYQAFPRSVCTSVNNVICHGIPDERALVDGDIVNIDVTVYLNGFHGDTSCTVLVGDVDEAGKTLVAATQESLDEALSVCGPGVPFSAIGDAVHKVAQAHKFSINKDFCGHGIGRQFHQPPLVLHYPNSAKDVMQVGMTFTVEPILCQGGAEYVRWPDNWTIVTQDGGRSAQFEHTVLVVEDGIRILT